MRRLFVHHESYAPGLRVQLPGVPVADRPAQVTAANVGASARWPDVRSVDCPAAAATNRQKADRGHGHDESSVHVPAGRLPGATGRQGGVRARSTVPARQ